MAKSGKLLILLPLSDQNVCCSIKKSINYQSDN